MVFTPHPTGPLFHPGLCLRLPVSGTGAVEGALGPKSDPARCPFVPAVGRLSTDSQTLVLWWQNPSAFFCLTRDKEETPV